MAQALPCKGKSGTVYQYEIYPIGHVFPAVAGNYIFAKEVAPGWWSSIYIGQTDNLSGRFNDHHKMQCIRAFGATHTLIHKNNGGEQARRDEENDIIENYNPPCNG